MFSNEGWLHNKPELLLLNGEKVYIGELTEHLTVLEGHKPMGTVEGSIGVHTVYIRDVSDGSVKSYRCLEEVVYIMPQLAPQEIRECYTESTFLGKAFDTSSWLEVNQALRKLSMLPYNRFYTTVLLKEPLWLGGIKRNFTHVREMFLKEELSRAFPEVYAFLEYYEREHVREAESKLVSPKHSEYTELPILTKKGE